VAAPVAIKRARLNRERLDSIVFRCTRGFLTTRVLRVCIVASFQCPRPGLARLPSSGQAIEHAAWASRSERARARATSCPRGTRTLSRTPERGTWRCKSMDVCAAFSDFLARCSMAA
jgi:hypothetical protein